MLVHLVLDKRLWTYLSISNSEPHRSSRASSLWPVPAIGLSGWCFRVWHGAVVSHRLPHGSKEPNEYASWTLSKSEINYAQVEKEALSLVFGIIIISMDAVHPYHRSQTSSFHLRSKAWHTPSGSRKDTEVVPCYCLLTHMIKYHSTKTLWKRRRPVTASYW